MDLAQEQDDADREAGALWALGPEAGAGATIWARVIADELERYDEARQRFAVGTKDEATWERLYGIGMVLLVALAQVVSFGERVLSMTGDAALRRAVDEFSAKIGNATEMRDLAMHLDAYAVGRGHRQTSKGRAGSPIWHDSLYPEHRWISTTIHTGTENETETPEYASVSIGDDAINLHRAAELAVPLAASIEQARWRYEQLARERADALIQQILDQT